MRVLFYTCTRDILLTIVRFLMVKMNKKYGEHQSSFQTLSKRENNI